MQDVITISNDATTLIQFIARTSYERAMAFNHPNAATVWMQPELCYITLRNLQPAWSVTRYERTARELVDAGIATDGHNGIWLHLSDVGIELAMRMMK